MSQRDDNRGVTLVEILLVIAIMSIMVTVTSAGISLIYSRDAEKSAKYINSALEKAKMLSLSKKGTCTLSVNGANHTLFINFSTEGTVEEIGLPENVTIAVSAWGSARHTEGEKVTIEFDKTSGRVKEVAIDDAVLADEDYYMVKINAQANSSKKQAEVLLVKATGKHYIEYSR